MRTPLYAQHWRRISEKMRCCRLSHDKNGFCFVGFTVPCNDKYGFTLQYKYRLRPYLSHIATPLFQKPYLSHMLFNKNKKRKPHLFFCLKSIHKPWLKEGTRRYNASAEGFWRNMLIITISSWFNHFHNLSHIRLSIFESVKWSELMITRTAS